MLNVNDFIASLKSKQIDFFCGVPDSLLKDFCAYLSDNVISERNIIAANEGNAIAIASGHYLSTGNPACVYMQNSGLGNIVNPLLSLTDEEVYNIPVLLIIGWRGEPNIHDEPQHIKQGKLTLPLLETLGIEYEILESCNQVSKAYEYMKKTNKPFALVVRKSTFEKYEKEKTENQYKLSREDAIKTIITLLDDKDIIVSTTGKISRELYENRQTHEKDFFTVGSMGHASSIALGIAINKPERKVLCFDGDGAFLMHMGAVPVIASMKRSNFKHIIFNNEAHDTVGGQPTVCSNVDIKNIALSSGYSRAYSVSSIDGIKEVWNDFYTIEGTNLLEVKVKCGARKDLGRPKEKCKDNKELFMKFLRG